MKQESKTVYWPPGVTVEEIANYYRLPPGRHKITVEQGGKAKKVVVVVSQGGKEAISHDDVPASKK